MCDVVILCGGKGSRLSEETTKRPKPMVEIAGRPILWHIMKIYSHFGFKRFILPLGYKGYFIKEYFYNYRAMGSDFSLKLDPSRHIEYHNNSDEKHWEITFVDTGEETLKGGRIKRVAKYIKSDLFHLTYGDGLGNIDIAELHRFHRSHGRIGTLTSVRPPSRFGELALDEDNVLDFEEKPQMGAGAINGGFFVFDKRFLEYLTEDEHCDFEFGALQKIAREGQLKAFQHLGFWQCMDNVRERDYLEKLANSGNAPWVLWN
jgi:glucose-1-phosphate cytidylyltransferase